MNEEIITDLKQFITFTVSQQINHHLNYHLAEQTKQLRKEFKQGLNRLEKKMEQDKEEVLTAIGDTMERHIAYTDKRFDNHEIRISRLEHKPA